MGNAQLADLVRRAHEGEVLGEALFTRLASLETDDSSRKRLRAAQLLEQQTREAAERLARDIDVEVDLGDPDGPRDAGVRAADTLAALAWEEKMRAIANATGSYRSLYEDLRAAVPDPDHPAVAQLLAHEQALNAFAQAEADGRDGLPTLLVALDDDRRRALA